MFRVVVIEPIPDDKTLLKSSPPVSAIFGSGGSITSASARGLTTRSLAKIRAVLDVRWLTTAAAAR
ncbi:hypothetical protein AC628_25910 [Bradyrhizobium sp. NAS96.2]|nr:hypothetical protein AC628_25910 [Bradyrhizobium sp. NAS96.2]